MLSVEYELRAVRIDVGAQMVYADVHLRITDGEKEIAQNQRTAICSLQDLECGPRFLSQLLQPIKDQVAKDDPTAPIYLPATPLTVTRQVRPILGEPTPA